MASVVIVEDDPWMADCYTAWLTAAGHTTRHAADAYDAIDTIDESPPDVILLDLFLPYANGVQLLQTLRSHADLANVPILLCSSSLPAQLPDMQLYGVHAVFEKAMLGPRQLNQAIAEVLYRAAV